MSTRLVHRPSTDGLSAEAVRLMTDGFRSGKPYRRIAEDLRAIGAPVAERTIARRAAEWRTEQRRRDALSQLGSAPAGSKGFEAALEFVEHVDLGRGCLVRSARRIRSAVRHFLRRPSVDSAVAAQKLLLEYLLQSRAVASATNVGPRADEEVR